MVLNRSRKLQMGQLTRQRCG